MKLKPLKRPKQRGAHKVLVGEEGSVNGGFPFGITIGDYTYRADSFVVDPYDGSPNWCYDGCDGHIHGKKMDGWVLKDFNPKEGERYCIRTRR